MIGGEKKTKGLKSKKIAAQWEWHRIIDNEAPPFPYNLKCQRRQNQNL